MPIVEAPATWVLRDFHSPNLLWLPEREGVARVGLLDFQDAVLGHAAYDVASLLQDARVDVPEMMEIALLSRYTRARLAAEPGFDAPGFARAYATLAAQRASKILGIFARLDRARRQAAIFASYAAGMGLSAALAGAPGAGAARRLVPRQRAGAEIALTMTERQTPRNAMVLAAGLGTRMRPLTDTMPKPLVEVAGKPLIDHVLDRLAQAGVERAVVNVHHFAEQIERHLAARKQPQIVISDERGAAARHRRRRGQGAAAAGRRAVLPHQFRHASGSTA